jgi:hypothetical protein
MPSWRGAQLKHRDNFTFTLSGLRGACYTTTIQSSWDSDTPPYDSVISSTFVVSCEDVFVIGRRDFVLYILRI